LVCDERGDGVFGKAELDDCLDCSSTRRELGIVARGGEQGIRATSLCTRGSKDGVWVSVSCVTEAGGEIGAREVVASEEGG